MNSRFTLIVIALLIGFAGIFWFTKNKDAPAVQTSNQPTSHTQGAGNKKVTLTEYGDFECPACGQYYPIIKLVKDTYKDDITFQFRHFPLVQIHQLAMSAHRAAEAAGKQGKFFEMHDLLYESQNSWKSSTNPTSLFESYATQLELNLDQFRQDVASEAVNDAINADIQEGQKLGATATPTFAINGKRIEENPRDFEGFKKLIDEAAAEAAQP